MGQSRMYDSYKFPGGGMEPGETIEHYGQVPRREKAVKSE